MLDSVNIHNNPQIEPENSDMKIWSLLERNNINIPSKLQVVIYALDEALRSESWEQLKHIDGISQLLRYFKLVYRKPDWGWKEFAIAINKQSHPEDRQIIWYFPICEIIEKINENNPVVMSEEEIAHRVCRLLRIQVHVYQPIAINGTTLTVNNIDKYRGDSSDLCGIICPAVEIDNTWSVITQDHYYGASYNNVQRYGAPQHPRSTDFDLSIATSLIQRKDADNETFNKLNELLTSKQYDSKYNQLAQFLDVNRSKDLSIQIDDVILNETTATALTVAMFNPDTMNVILGDPNKYKWIIELLNQVQSIITENIQPDAWPKIINEIIPVIDREEDDTELLAAIRTLDLPKFHELANNTNIHQPNRYGITPLHLASALENIEITDTILKLNCKDGKAIMSAQDASGRTALHYAALSENKYLVGNFLSKLGKQHWIFDCLKQDLYGQNVFHYAANHSNPANLKNLLRYFIYRNINISSMLNVQDYKGFTPLHYAAQRIDLTKESLTMVKRGASIAIDANPKFKQSDDARQQRYSGLKVTPWFLACEAGNCDLIYAISCNSNLWIQHGFSNSDISAILPILLLNGRYNLFSDLLWRKAFISDALGRKPIHLSAISGCLHTFSSVLRDYGDNSLNEIDNNGNTALHYAAEYGRLDIASLICKKISLISKSRKDENLNAATNNEYKIAKWAKGLFAKDKSKLISVDTLNNDGETPSLKALYNGHHEVHAVLVKAGAIVKNMEDLVYSIISNYIESEIPLSDDEKRNHIHRNQKILSNIADRLSGDGIMKLRFGELKRTFVHVCVEQRQYRYLRILLHLLTSEQRVDICSSKDNQNQSPYELIQSTKNIEYSEQGQSEINKIERLLLQYMPEEREKLSTYETMQYQLRWNQDYKNELVSTKGYQWASNALFWGPIAYESIKAFNATGYTWFALEAASQQFFGGDVLYNVERGLRTVNDYLHPKGMTHNIMSKVADGIHYAGYITQTTNRVANQLIRSGVALAGQKYLDHNYSSNRYLDVINRLGVALALSEGAYRHYGSDAVNGALGFSGIDSYLFPNHTINQLSYKALNTTNDLIYEQTGYNLKLHYKASYRYVRTTLGRVPTATSVFEQAYLPQFKSDCHVDDELFDNHLSPLAKVLFEDAYDFRGGEHALMHLEILSHYARTGVFTREVSNTLSVAQPLLAHNGVDTNALIYNLASSSTYVKDIQVNQVEQEEAAAGLKNILSKIDFTNTELGSEALYSAISEYHNNVIRRDIENKITSVSDQQLLSEDSICIIKELVASKIENIQDDSYRFHNHFNQLLAFAQSGVIPKEEKSFLDFIGHDRNLIIERISRLYTSSYSYIVFNFDRDTEQRHQALLVQELENALNDESFEAGFDEGLVARAIEATNKYFANDFIAGMIQDNTSCGQSSDSEPDFCELFSSLNVYLLEETWNKPSERYDVISRMSGYLSGRGSLNEQSEYLLALVQQAKKHEIDQVGIATLFKESMLVRQFNLNEELIDKEIETLLKRISRDNIFDTESLSTTLSESLRNLADSFIDNVFFNNMNELHIKDERAAKMLQSGLRDTLLDCANQPDKFQTTARSVWEIFFQGILTDENIDVLDRIAASIAMEDSDVADVVSYLFVNTPGYLALEFNSSTVENHRKHLADRYRDRMEDVDNPNASATYLKTVNTIISNDFVRKLLTPLSDNEDAALNQYQIHELVEISASFIGSSWSNLEERGLRVSMMHAFLSGQGSLDSQLDCFSRVLNHLKIDETYDSNAVKVLYRNSGIVKQFNLQDSDIEDQVGTLMQRLSNADSDVRDILENAFKTSATQFVEQTFINGPQGVSDNYVSDVLKKTLPSLIMSNITDSTRFEATIQGAWNIIFNGSVSEDNIDVFENLYHSLEQNGYNPSDSLAYVLTHSSAYNRFGLNEKTISSHQTILAKQIKENRSLQTDLLSVFNSTSPSGFKYLLSEAGEQAFHDAHKDNVLTSENLSATIDYHKNTIIDAALKSDKSSSAKRSDIANQLADVIIRYKYPYYPEIGDEISIQAERVGYFSDLFLHTLNHFDSSKSRRRERCKPRVYNYLLGKITDTPVKKRHHHRWEYLVKVPLNEIADKTIGWMPFPNYNERTQQRAKQTAIGIQGKVNGNGDFSTHITNNGRPIATIYDSAATHSQSVPRFEIQSSRTDYSSQQGIRPDNHFHRTNDLISIESLPDYLRFPINQHQQPGNRWFEQGPHDLISEMMPTHPDLETYRFQPKSQNNSPSSSIPMPSLRVNESNGGMIAISTRSNEVPSNCDSICLNAGGNDSVQNVQSNDVSVKPSNTYQTGQWFNLLRRSILGERSIEIAEWQTYNRDHSPSELISLVDFVKQSKIPLKELPGIFGEAAADAAIAFVKGGIETLKFTGDEIGRLSRLEEPATVKAIKLLSTFVGDEYARYLMDQDLEISKFAKTLVNNFNAMDRNQRVQSLAELGFGVVFTSVASKASGAVAAASSVAVDQIAVSSNKVFTIGYNRYIGGCPAGSNLPFRANYQGSSNAYKLLFPEHVEPIKNIKINPEHALTFLGGNYESYVVKQNIIVSRAGNGDTSLGQFYTRLRPVSAVQARIDVAIPHKWSSGKHTQLSYAYDVLIPKGTSIHIGSAAPQGDVYLGGMEQIFIEKPWDIEGVKVINKTPLLTEPLCKLKVKK